MVYCGKPSKACAECRRKRTKCDALRPSCSQCIRAGRVCQGYRDPDALRFRDESHGLASKSSRPASAKGHSATVSAASSPRSDVSIVCTSSSTLERQPADLRLNPLSSLALNLGTSVEEQATCFFFGNYILEQSNFYNGNFQYMTQLYACEAIRESLAETVVCLGLVGLANFWKAPSIMSGAIAQYNSALKIINSALTSAAEARSDQTLVAVMLLGLYETNTCSSPQSMRSWTKHIAGATALMTLRGKQQLRTPVEHDLFVHLRSQVIANSLRRRTRIPPAINALSEALHDYENEEEAAVSRLCEIAVEFCNIRASMNSFRDYRNSDYIVSCMRALEQEYMEWLSSFPSSFFYSTVPLTERSDEVFSDSYDVYSSIWIASVWNHYRCVRILVHELLLDQVQYILRHPETHTLSPEKLRSYEGQALASKSIVLQLCHEICASVPFYLGFSAKGSDQASRLPPKTVCGNLLLWPLYVAGCTGPVSDMMRNWLAGRLRMISDIMGIQQGRTLAHTMSMRQDLLQWEMKEDHPVDVLTIEGCVV